MFVPSEAERNSFSLIAIILILFSGIAGAVAIPAMPSNIIHPGSSFSTHPAKSSSFTAAPHMRATLQGSGKPNQGVSPPPAVWDEQMGLTFAQDLPGLQYNVSAVAQSDSNGYGPAYLLNGLTDRGYWYQVGLNYNWALTAGGYNPGFAFAYEVFNSTGSSVFPKNGDGGLQNYSGVIHPGDLVLLSLQFTSGQVMMYSKDWNTSASATQNFTALGGALFVGLASSSNSRGFFSGLMTEQYHAAPYYGSEAKVTYGNPYFGINAATMWADEWNPSTNLTLFGSAGPEISYSNPTQYQSYSLNGTQEESNAYYFVTGTYSLIAVTLSYSISGGSVGSLSPKLNYSSDGTNQSVVLTANPTTYFMDSGTKWSATNPLSGSSSTQKWISSVSGGNVTGTAKISLVYVHQFYAVFSASPIGSGVIQPTGSGWFPSGSPIALSAEGTSPYLFVKWTTNTTKISFSNANLANSTVTITGPGSITADFALVAITLSTNSGTAAQGAQISTTATITGPNGSVSLSIQGLPSGVTVTWSNNPVMMNLKGATDELNISTSISTVAGTYPLTIIATSTNGSNSAQYVLSISRVIPLAVSFSLSSGSTSQTPIINYTYDGKQFSANLSQTLTTIYVDNNSTWKESGTLGGLSLQRWVTNSSIQGIVTSAKTINFYYFHQYAVNFQYKIVDGGNPPSPPTVSILSLGARTSSIANGSHVWADALSSYSFSPFLNKSSTERWELLSNQTGIVSGPSSENSTYIHQMLVNASLEIIGSGLGSISPKLSFQHLETSMSTLLSANQTSLWMDAGTKWSVPSNLSSFATGERWIDVSSNSSGLVGLQSPLIRYETQYYVSVGANNPLAGTVPMVKGWYNASLFLPISERANSGWKFAIWLTNGVQNFSNTNSTSLLVMGPINETAVFYAGLSITAGDNGHVDYGYGTVSGTVSAGSTSTVYVPPGTTVSLNAIPDSTFYSSGGWNNRNGSSSTSTQNIAISAPTTVGATFIFNILPIAIAAVLVGVVAAVAVIIVKRGGSRQFTDSAGHGWKW